MNKSMVQLSLVIVLMMTAVASCNCQQPEANPILGEWYVGIVDDEAEGGFIFREDATTRFDEKYMYKQKAGVVVERSEYTIKDNYITLLENGVSIKCLLWTDFGMTQPAR